MHIYAQAEELLIDRNISTERRSTKSLEVAKILKDIDPHCLATELTIVTITLMLNAYALYLLHCSINSVVAAIANATSERM